MQKRTMTRLTSVRELPTCFCQSVVRKWSERSLPLRWFCLTGDAMRRKKINYPQPNAVHLRPVGRLHGALACSSGQATLTLLALLSSGFVAPQWAQASAQLGSVTREYTTEFNIENLALEESNADKVAGLTRIEEIDLEDDEIEVAAVRPLKSNLALGSKVSVEKSGAATISSQNLLKPATANALPIVTNVFNDDGVPIEVLHNERAKYRLLMAGALKRLDPEPRFLGSLDTPSTMDAATVAQTIASAQLGLDMGNADISSSGAAIVEPATLSSEKIYTVVDGRIVEVAPVDTPVAKQHKSAFLKPPPGWIIRAYPDATDPASQEQPAGSLAQTAPAIPGVRVEFPSGGTPGLFPSLALANSGKSGALVSRFSNKSQYEKDAVDKLVNSQAGGVANASPKFSIDPSAIDKLLPYPDGTSATQSSSEQNARLVSVHGHVTVPAGVDPSRVVLRMAGTPWQIQADREGFFEFRDIPLGSKFEVVVWHQDGSLNRRIVPLAATSTEREYQIELQRTDFVDSLAATFSSKQDMSLSGFCAQVTASKRILLEGAKVSLTGVAEFQGPFYYNNNNLPDAAQKELSQDGRFCVFNAKSNLVQINVQALNGMRRTFQVHLEPSTFEISLNFDLDSSVYRPVASLELIDSQASFEASTSGELLRFGDSHVRSWVQGQDSAIWNSVIGVNLLTDSSYAPKLLEARDSKEMQYFPAGQDLVEIGWSGDTPAAPKAHQLIARDDLYTPRMNAWLAKSGSTHGILKDSKDALVLKFVDGDVIDDLQQLVNYKTLLKDEGAAFVSMNLAGLELDYTDVQLSLRDSWTGAAVSQFHFIPQPAGVKNPRLVRGFFSNIPQGQYTLLITDKKGALRWVDVVRSRPGSFQVLSIRE